MKFTDLRRHGGRLPSSESQATKDMAAKAAEFRRSAGPLHVPVQGGEADTRDARSGVRGLRGRDASSLYIVRQAPRTGWMGFP